MMPMIPTLSVSKPIVIKLDPVALTGPKPGNAGKEAIKPQLTSQTRQIRKHSQTIYPTIFVYRQGWAKVKLKKKIVVWGDIDFLGKWTLRGCIAAAPPFKREWKSSAVKPRILGSRNHSSSLSRGKLHFGIGCIPSRLSSLTLRSNLDIARSYILFL